MGESETDLGNAAEVGLSVNWLVDTALENFRNSVAHIVQDTLSATRDDLVLFAILKLKNFVQLSYWCLKLFYSENAVITACSKNVNWWAGNVCDFFFVVLMMGHFYSISRIITKCWRLNMMQPNAILEVSLCSLIKSNKISFCKKIFFMYKLIYVRHKWQFKNKMNYNV